MSESFVFKVVDADGDRVQGIDEFFTRPVVGPAWRFPVSRSPMQVNHAVKLKSAADRPHLDGMLHEIAAQRAGLTYEIRDSPEHGALGLPLYTTVSFSAERGSQRALEDEVNAAIEQAGLAGRFEPA